MQKISPTMRIPLPPELVNEAPCGAGEYFYPHKFSKILYKARIYK